MEENAIVIVNGELAPKTLELIRNFETKKKEIEEQYNHFKSELLNAMEQNGIIKFKNDDVEITYIAETEREDFDKKQFKADMPDLYDEYVKFSKVKSSVRIKVK